MPIPLKRYETMDVYILVSAVNMQLRDFFSNLEDLCKSHEIDENILVKRLKDAGFEYNIKENQFK